jgi:fructokinase
MPERPTIVGIGEILWDMFPEGPQFGGAPANFTCHAAELGRGEIDAYVVSAVGQDKLGDQALTLLNAHKVNTTFVARCDRLTGQVHVHVDSAGQASYEFASDTAWDNIPWSSHLSQLAIRADAVCFGTLAQRDAVSRETIQQFVRSTRSECMRIFDINLRAPFWNNEIIIESLQLANVVKLNETELETLAKTLGFNRPLPDILQHLLATYKLRLVALTRGPAGALITSSSGEQSDFPGQDIALVNTVGAGDAFTGVLAVGALNGLALETINAWANRVAAFVCTQPGAAPRLPAHLQHP